MVVRFLYNIVRSLADFPEAVIYRISLSASEPACHASESACHASESACHASESWHPAFESPRLKFIASGAPAAGIPQAIAVREPSFRSPLGPASVVPRFKGLRPSDQPH
jgi:hypothetical protein